MKRSLRFRILVRDDFSCQYCGRRAPSVELEVDHRLPRALGGTDDEWNLTTACVDCNRGKSAAFDTTLTPDQLERLLRQTDARHRKGWQTVTMRDLVGAARR